MTDRNQNPIYISPRKALCYDTVKCKRQMFFLCSCQQAKGSGVEVFYLTWINYIQVLEQGWPTPVPESHNPAAFLGIFKSMAKVSVDQLGK